MMKIYEGAVLKQRSQCVVLRLYRTQVQVLKIFDDMSLCEIKLGYKHMSLVILDC